MLTLTGTTGTFTMDFALTSADDHTIRYTPTDDGLLFVQVGDDSHQGLKVGYQVYDDNGEHVQDDDYDPLGVVWQAGQPLQVIIAPTFEDNPNRVVQFTWSYAPRASSVINVAFEDAEVQQTPAGLLVHLSNGAPNELVTISLVGPTVITGFATTRLDDFGNHADYMVDLPAVPAGQYYLRVEGAISGGDDSPFEILNDALDWGDDTPKPVDTPPVTDPAQHWRFYDLRDPDVTWTFVRNPSSWSNVFPPNDFTHAKTTAPDGQPLTWEAAQRPWRMEFKGFIETEQEYDQLAFWSQLRRRFWLIDHRNRAWLLTIEQFDAQALIKPRMPWAHDYTVRALIFMQGTRD